MSEVLDRIREKYPVYADVPDDKLTAALGDKYPVYLDRDENFRKDFERVRYGATQEGLQQAEKLADVMAAAKLTPAEKHSEFLTNLAGWMEWTAQKLEHPIRTVGEVLDVPFDVTINRNHPEYQHAIANALSKPTVQLGRVPESSTSDVTMTPSTETMSKIAPGVADAASEFVEQMSTPENLLMLPAGVSKAVLAGWTALMARDAPDRIVKADALLKEGRTREAVKEMATGGGELLLGGLMMRQTAAPPKFAEPGEILNFEKTTEPTPTGETLSPEGYRVLGGGLFESDTPPPIGAYNVGKTTVGGKTLVGGKTTWTFRLPAKEVSESEIEPTPEAAVKATEEANAPLTAAAVKETTGVSTETLPSPRMTPEAVSGGHEPIMSEQRGGEKKSYEEKVQEKGQEGNVLATQTTAAEPSPPPVPPEGTSTAAARIPPSPEGGIGIIAPHAGPLVDMAMSLLGVPGEIAGTLRDTMKSIAGISMPKITAAMREVGEAGVRWASSRIAAKPNALLFTSKVLEGLDIDPMKFGAALTEDNLRSVRKDFEDKAAEATANGDTETATRFTERANRVTTLIGSRNSPFQTETEYQAYLADPTTQQAIQRHIQNWNDIIDPQYRAAQGIDPDMELPSRGLQTGARINLKALKADEPATQRVGGTAGGRLTASFKRKSPFGREAKGTGESYDIDYSSIISNTFERQLEIANQNTFNRMLVENELGVVSAKAPESVAGEPPSKAIPLQHRLILSDGRVFAKNENLYLPRSLEGEYRNALNADLPHKYPVTKLFTGLNLATLVSLVEPTTHVSNLITALTTRPNSKLLLDTAGRLLGRADIPVTVGRVIAKAFTDNKEQMAELSTIGALREQFPQHPLNLPGKAIKALDRTVRMVMDDSFQDFVRQGLVEDTETNRREFVNQVGQYNKLLQGQFTRWLRDTQIGPFVTAGKTFNTLGVRTATMQPGLKAATPQAQAMFVANQVAGWVGTYVLIGTLNYLFTKDKGGGMTGRPGIPLGNVDFGTDDKDGKPQSLPLSAALGYDRALRVVGAKGAIEAKRKGLTDADAIDAAAGNIINSWASPAMGPIVREGAVATTGYQPYLGPGLKPVQVAPQAPPGKSQVMENIKETGREANPLVKSYLDIKAGKTPQEALSKQLPRFTLQSGPSETKVAQYPKAVNAAQLNNYVDYVVREAKKLPRGERQAKVREMLDKDEVFGANRAKAMKKIEERIKYP